MYVSSIVRERASIPGVITLFELERKRRHRSCHVTPRLLPGVCGCVARVRAVACVQDHFSAMAQVNALLQAETAALVAAGAVPSTAPPSSGKQWIQSRINAAQAGNSESPASGGARSSWLATTEPWKSSFATPASSHFGGLGLRPGGGVDDNSLSLAKFVVGTIRVEANAVDLQLAQDDAVRSLRTPRGIHKNRSFVVNRWLQCCLGHEYSMGTVPVGWVDLELRIRTPWT